MLQMIILRTKSLVFGFFVFFHSVYLSHSQPYDYPSAKLSTSWTNSPSLPHSVNFTDGSLVRSILLRGTFGPRFACGFYCNGTCNSYLFAIFIVQTNMSRITLSGFPQVVWSANRNNPVSINATVRLTADGDLVLKDTDGTVAWSTNTTGKSVAGLNLTDMGNLVLFDDNNRVVWQSFDHPTDALVPGQRLVSGMKLVPSVSATNWTEMSLLSISVTDEGMVAAIESNPPQVYVDMLPYGTKTNREPTYVTLRNGSFALFMNSSDPDKPDMLTLTPISEAKLSQYVRFFPDGHFRLYEWGTGGWTVVADLLSSQGYECFYPTVCGSYGICSKSVMCSCPSTTYFKQTNDREPNLGCSVVTPLSCEASQNHSFLELKDTTYSSFQYDVRGVDLETCRLACSTNCSCKAAIFQYGPDPTNGNCYLPNEVFSLIDNDKEKTYYNSTVYLKVQNASKLQDDPTTVAVVPPLKRKSHTAGILWSTLGSLFSLILVTGIVLLAWKKRNSDEDEEDYLDQVPGMPTRFSYEALKAATDNFSKMLGEGGFGSVFEGTLLDGTKIAVKCLNGLGQVRKSFLAEVESIGSIHHVNLVRLVGFCADKSHRLLVYDYMSNGSLDKWIFHQNEEFALGWQQRKKIILDIAKGLTYLHEDCMQKIIHLDIKPQNILLDPKLNAKISDFGLSKLIDRDQSKVVTTMRGTPGYLAPEWLNSVITEKTDIYSFGVVLLEILCGRRNIDQSQPEEQMHLLALFEKKADSDELFDLVNISKDMQLHREEILDMMKLAAWCLQKDYTKRPSMSTVVKVLEDGAKVEQNLDFNVSNPLPMTMEIKDTTQLFASVLSGPR